MTALLTVENVAEMLNVSVKFVYRHADELGGYRMGTAPTAPLRFDPRAIESWLAERRLTTA